MKHTRESRNISASVLFFSFFFQFRFSKHTGTHNVTCDVRIGHTGEHTWRVVASRSIWLCRTQESKNYSPWQGTSTRENRRLRFPTFFLAIFFLNNLHPSLASKWVRMNSRWGISKSFLAVVICVFIIPTEMRWSPKTQKQGYCTWKNLWSSSFSGYGFQAGPMKHSYGITTVVQASQQYENTTFGVKIKRTLYFGNYAHTRICVPAHSPRLTADTAHSFCGGNSFKKKQGALVTVVFFFPKGSTDANNLGMQSLRNG